MIATPPLTGSGYLVAGPFARGTVLDSLTLWVTSMAAAATFRVALCPSAPGSAADMDAGMLLVGPTNLGTVGMTNPTPLVLPIRRTVDDNRFAAVEVTAAGAVQVALFADAHTPLPLPLDDVPLPPPPPPAPSRRRPDPATQPRSGQRDGRGDIVFVQMVKQALTEFFGQAKT